MLLLDSSNTFKIMKLRSNQSYADFDDDFMHSILPNSSMTTLGSIIHLL